MEETKKNIILIGGGGHCKSCIEVIESTEKYNIVGVLDLPSELGKKILNYEVIGNDDDYLKYKTQGCCFLITAGQIKSAALRKRIFEKLESIKAEIETIIAPTASVSNHAEIGKGTIVMHHSIVNAGAKIGKNCIVNTNSLLEHDVTVGNHSHISTKAAVNGDAKVGNDTFVGSMSCISNGIEVGNQIIIGAGSIVTENCLEAGVYVGSPARKIIK